MGPNNAKKKPKKKPSLWEQMWQTPGGPVGAQAKPGAKSIGERINFNNSTPGKKKPKGRK